MLIHGARAKKPKTKPKPDRNKPLDDHDPQDVTDAELLALAGPSQGDVDPANRLSSVVADSARRWLAATDDSESSEGEGMTNAGDDGRGNGTASRVDEETIIM